jgi:2-amino-4-hydroxy-6-hydroxymethyldihydropteridine diphosphokinase
LDFNPRYGPFPLCARKSIPQNALPQPPKANRTSAHTYVTLSDDEGRETVEGGDQNSITRAYVGLGSNVGDRAGYLLLAIHGMMRAGLPIKRLSSVYETEPVDLREQPRFLNMVAELEGALPPPEAMLRALLHIERELGRHRQVARGPRTIDLDLLLYADLQLRTELLILPHPRLHLRRFVLTPLAEIAPLTIHPSFGKTVRQLLAEVNDESAVRLWRPARDRQP